MNLTFSKEDLEFQSQAQAFIDKHWPKSARAGRDGRQRFTPRSGAEQKWFSALVAAGWSVPNWPEVHGGTQWTATQKYIWERATSEANCPQMSPFGARMLAPVLYTWGTPEQQQKFLPPIREAKVHWCQGYSEAGAGSDLAALSTTAVRDGNDYIVEGSKTWTTGAHIADWIFCLVRTDSKRKKRQEGISFLLIDMKSKGISVRPIITLGQHHNINQVTLDQVRVPASQLVGEENKGWTYAKGLLAHERTGIAGVARSRMAIKRLREVAQNTSQDAGTLADDEAFRYKLHNLEIDLMALEITELRVLAQLSQGETPGPESSILKIKGTEISQQISELAVEAHGYYALPYTADPDFLDNEGPIGPDTAEAATSAFLMGRASSIFGGSNEIQRNIIAKAVLGL